MEELDDLLAGLPSDVMAELNEIVGRPINTAVFMGNTNEEPNTTPQEDSNTQPETAVVPEETDTTVEGLVLQESTGTIEREVLTNDETTNTTTDVIQEPAPSTLVGNIERRITELSVAVEDLKEKEIRYSGAEWFQNIKNSSITIIGAGGISSWAGVILSKMGARLVIYDDDIYEPTNLAGQLCLLEHLGWNKARSLTDLCVKLGGSYVVGRADKFTKSSNTGLICIVGVDNMETRKAALNKWHKEFGHFEDALFIDGRLEAEIYQIYCIPGGPSVDHYVEQYLKEWVPSTAIPDAACSFKQTSYMAAGIGSRIAEIVAAFLTPPDSVPRFIPFMIEHTPYGEFIRNYPSNI